MEDIIVICLVLLVGFFSGCMCSFKNHKVLSENATPEERAEWLCFYRAPVKYVLMTKEEVETLRNFLEELNSELEGKIDDGLED